MTQPGYDPGAGRCYVIAEAGINHNGDPDLALQLVDVAARAGADAVKFQAFRVERLVSPSTPMAEYQKANTGVEQSQAEMLAGYALDEEIFAAITERARERGLAFLCTPFDEGSADAIGPLVKAFKVPSGELTNALLLEHLAAKGKPMLLSTGMATLEEVRDALRVVRAVRPVPVAVLHCVTAYPAAPGDCNLTAMTTMRAALRVPIGWSDHTQGTAVTLAAVALGASIIEKHFTLDRTMAGPDHAASLEPDELTSMIRDVRIVEAALGDGRKIPMEAERANARLVRKSLHAARGLHAGRPLERADVEALRPGTGIAPTQLHVLLGRRLTRNVAVGEPLSEGDFA